MFESMRRVFVESVEKTWHTLASHGEAGEQPWDEEPNLYKKDIMMCASQLRDGVDVDVKVQAIRKMGHLAYTGGTDVAKFTGSYLETLSVILKDDTSPPSLKTQVVKSLSEICRAHRDNCQRAESLALTPDLARLIQANESEPRLVRWCCYALVVLCSSGMSYLRTLMEWSDGDSGSFKEILEELENESWKGWPRNYAAVLRDFLGHVTVDLNVKK
ncbi:armadillo-like helical domain-containing protein 2 [Asterias amurensis]|uniref:armadillo-like helical domain-containing protein 2 n=1 Tax=Asterias amurensis TaxID=7602 RepID=UPI003AB5BF3F